MKVRVSEQGELVKVLPKINRAKYVQSRGGGVRKAITAFTKRSQKNLLDKFATIDKQKAKNATFVTLTYVENFQNHKEAYRHIDLFLKRIEYHHGRDGFFACWKKEPQQRGAIHFHVMLWNVGYIDKVWLANTWSEISNQWQFDKRDSQGFDWYLPAFTRIEFCRAQRKAWYYVSKYLGKVSGGFEGGFNIATNSETAIDYDDSYDVPMRKNYNPVREGVNQPIGELGRRLQSPKRKGVGRYWGWFNRKNIPFAQEIVTEIEMSWEEYRRWRWDIAQVFPHARKSMLGHALKLYWFYEFVSPISMFIDGVDGKMVLGWYRSDSYRISAEKER